MKSDPRHRHPSRTLEPPVWDAAPERPLSEPAPEATTAPDPRPDLAKAGLWTAVLIWPVGAVIGIMLLTRDRTREGATALAIATIVGVLSVTLLAPSGSADSCMHTAQGTTLCGPDAVAWCRRNAPPPALIRPSMVAGSDASAPKQLGSADGLCGAAH
jgi:hypothetical protein